MEELVEVKKVLERQLHLLSEESEKPEVSGATLAAISEQIVNVGKFLLDVSPAANRITRAKP